MEAVRHSRPIHYTDLPERDPRIGEMVRGFSVCHVEQVIIEGFPEHAPAFVVSELISRR